MQIQRFGKHCHATSLKWATLRINVLVSAAAAFVVPAAGGSNRVRWPHRKRSPHFTDEVCRVIRAAHARVVRDLWIRTEWPCHVDTVVADSRCDQPIGCDSGFAPALHRSHPVHLVRARSTSAMLHTGYHEESQPILLFCPIRANTLE